MKMLKYNGACLTTGQLRAFEESMTFSDAKEGYSREDIDRIYKHLSHCSRCRERRDHVIAGYLEENQLRRLAQ